MSPCPSAVSARAWWALTREQQLPSTPASLLLTDLFRRHGFHIPGTATCRKLPHFRNCQIQENAISRKMSRIMQHPGQCHIPETATSWKLPNLGKREIPQKVKSRTWKNTENREIQQTVKSRKLWNPANIEIQQKVKSWKL